MKLMNNTRKLPPLGKELQARINFDNPPLLVVVCIGADAWRSAKDWQKSVDFHPLIMPARIKPSDFRWPVPLIPCLIEWDVGPSESLIIELVKVLLRSDALSVTVRPLWVDVAEPLGYYDTTKSPPLWVQTREIVRTYFHHSAKEAVHVTG